MTIRSGALLESWERSGTLNLLWLVCCIPVFTAGAATTAVYYVTLKLVRDEDDSTIKSFFRSFIQNFKQATAIWLSIL